MLIKNKGLTQGYNDAEEKAREEYEKKLALREKYEEEEKKKKDEEKEESKFDY
jgi:hypothetical protein